MGGIGGCYNALARVGVPVRKVVRSMFSRQVYLLHEALAAAVLTPVHAHGPRSLSSRLRGAADTPAIMRSHNPMALTLCLRNTQSKQAMFLPPTPTH